MNRRTTKRSGAYQIINEVNGKSYIGSSVDIDNRWDQHRYTFKKHVSPTRSLLHRAVKKYGIENFTFIVLEECEPVKGVLLEREQFYIDTLKPEYNLLPLAGSRLGSKLSPETIEKLRGRKHTEEWKQRASVWAAAYMSDPEVKHYYSELRKGKTFEEIFGEERAKEILARQSENRTGKHVGFDPWNKGVPLTDEQRAKMEASGFWDFTEERRQKLSEAHIGLTPWNLGVPWSEEAKQKMSEAHIGKESPMKGVPRPEELKKLLSDIAVANFDPEHQQRMTEAARIANTGKARSDETRQKISESNLESEKRKAYAESRRGVARPKEELGEKVSASLQTSEKAKAYHEGRVGKSRGNNPSGHYGVIWDKARSKYQVRIKGKSYGRYQQLEDAIAKAKETMAELGMLEQEAV